MSGTAFLFLDPARMAELEQKIVAVRARES
jgi:hypothetical protein